MRRTARRHRGVTFLEVLFSSALLSVAAATITGAFATVERLATRDEKRLAAYQVAHRLILQCLDNPNQMPPDSVPQEQVVRRETVRFYYLLQESVLLKDDNAGGEATVRRAENANLVASTDLLSSALLMLTVQIYEEEGGRRAAEPIATLSRVKDLLGDADSDPEAFMQWIIRAFKDNPAVQQMLMQAAEAARQAELLKQQRDSGMVPTELAPQPVTPAPATQNRRR